MDEFLNPELHRLLASVFGEVKVANKGRPITWHLPPRNVVGAAKGSDKWAAVYDWGEVYRVNCTCCGDSRQRLFFSHAAGAHMKQKTGAPLRFSRSMCKCHNEDCTKHPVFKEWLYKKVKVPSPDLSKIYEKHNKKAKETKAAMFQQTEVSLPTPSYALEDPNTPGFARDWVQQVRGFNLQQLHEQFMCRFAPAGATWSPEIPDEESEHMNAAGRRRWRKEREIFFSTDRLVIPVIQRRKLISWQARKFETESKRPKYRNPPGSHKAEWLYNMDTALLYDDIVIVEGPPDVWRVGPHAVAVFGKDLSEMQMAIMKTLWGERGQAIIMLDSVSEDKTAGEKAVEMQQKLSQYSVFPRGAWPAWLRQGDPGEADEAELEELEQQTRETLDYKMRKAS